MSTLGKVPVKQTGDSFFAPECNKISNWNSILTDYYAGSGGVLTEDFAYENAVNESFTARRSAFTVGGSANAITLTTALTGFISIKRFVLGQEFIFIANSTNTGATTIAVDVAPSVNIKSISGGDLSGDEIKAGLPVHIRYSGSFFQLLNSQKLGSEVVKTNTLTFARINNDVLRMSIGKANAEDDSQYIKFTSTYDLNIGTVGLGGRASGVNRSNSTWYYIFAFAKTDGTSMAVLDTSSIGANAETTATANSFLVATKRLVGVWQTDSSGFINSNILNNFVNHYEINNKSVNDFTAGYSYGVWGLRSIPVPLVKCKCFINAFVNYVAGGESSVALTSPSITQTKSDASVNTSEQWMTNNVIIYTSTAQINTILISGSGVDVGGYVKSFELLDI
jgi:hypothetical protein